MEMVQCIVVYSKYKALSMSILECPVDRLHWLISSSGSLDVPVDHLSTIDWWVTDAWNRHVTGQLPVNNVSGRWLANWPTMHMDIGGQHRKSINWSVNHQEMVLAEKKVSPLLLPLSLQPLTSTTTMTTTMTIPPAKPHNEHLIQHTSSSSSCSSSSSSLGEMSLATEHHW